MKKGNIMKIKSLLSVSVCVLLSACSGAPTAMDRDGSSNRIQVCKGLSCGASLPGQIKVHKPTKEERNRVQRGEAPDFGSEVWSIGGTFPW